MHRALFSLPLLLLAACSPISAGDYAVYRIGYNQSALGADCYSDGEVPENIANDTSTFLGPATFVIWRAADGQHFLDMGGSLIPGSHNGGGDFNFNGASVDVQKFDGYGGYTTYYGYSYGGVDPKTTTTTVQTDIILTLKGQSVSGTQTGMARQECSGRGCEDYDTFSCTSTTTFVGTKVREADVEYNLGGDDGGGGGYYGY